MTNIFFVIEVIKSVDVLTLFSAFLKFLHLFSADHSFIGTNFDLNVRFANIAPNNNKFDLSEIPGVITQLSLKIIK